MAAGVRWSHEKLIVVIAAVALIGALLVVPTHPGVALSLASFVAGLMTCRALFELRKRS